MLRMTRGWIRTGSEWLLPVLESRPAKMIGSSAPSSSGNATCHELQRLSATCSGETLPTATVHSWVAYQKHVLRAMPAHYSSL
jgi:hypothetical protein